MIWNGKRTAFTELTVARWAVRTKLMKLFAAIFLPDKIAGDVVREQKGVSGARWVSEERLHITLAFFGEVDADHAETARS